MENTNVMEENTQKKNPEEIDQERDTTGTPQLLLMQQVKENLKKTINLKSVKKIVKDM